MSRSKTYTVTEVVIDKSNDRIQRWVNLILKCRNSPYTVDEFCKKNGIAKGTYYTMLKECQEAGFKDVLPPLRGVGKQKLCLTKEEKLRRELSPYIEMAKEREEYGYTANEICLLHGVSKTDYYKKLKLAREKGLDKEIPAYTGRWSRKNDKQLEATRSSVNEVNLLLANDKVVKVARGDITFTMPATTPQETITKFVRALRSA